MTFRIGRAAGAAGMMVLAFATPDAHVDAQDTGIISGIVFDQATKAGLAGAEVQVLGTKLHTRSGPMGRYEFRAVPPGVYRVEGRRVGYLPFRDDSVDVHPGTIARTHLVLRRMATLLENVVTSANGLTSTDIAVPDRDAAQSLRGRVAGVSVSGSGIAGNEMSIQLRTPTSIRGRNRPLIIVDGVTLANDASTLDISTLDIRSIEILKGASASAMYGARGASGVIIIRTNRGRE